MLKLEAEEVDDDDHRKKLLAAAKLLADATAKMVEAAKVSCCQNNAKNANELGRE